MEFRIKVIVTIICNCLLFRNFLTLIRSLGRLGKVKRTLCALLPQKDDSTTSLWRMNLFSISNLRDAVIDLILFLFSSLLAQLLRSFTLMSNLSGNLIPLSRSKQLLLVSRSTKVHHTPFPPLKCSRS